MKKNKVIIFIILFILLVSCQSKSTNKNSHSKYLNESLDNFNNLMIVAHPDDETIWGGSHLIEDDYLVICITNRQNDKRKKEFDSVMLHSENKGIILDYPDKTNNKRDNWSSSKAQLKVDLQYILNAKKWDKIVTHNPDGEYGHQHHKMLSKLITQELKRTNQSNILFYFGKYYKKDVLSYYQGNEINNEQLDKKLELTKLYHSQLYVIDKYAHMLPYENWLSYDEWYK